MRSVFFFILFALGVGVAAGLLTTLFRFILTLLALNLFGERRFVETSATDGCAYFVNSGIVSFFAVTLVPVFEEARARPYHQHLHAGPAFWAIPLVSFAFALFPVVELWARGAGHRKQDFVIQDDAIVRVSDRTVLHPTRVVQERNYIETALACGYTLYALVLHDTDGTTVRNGYLSEDEMRQMLRRVLALARPQDCRAMEDLCFVWPESETRLQRATFGQEWSGVLCGSLARLSDESRVWWRQWLMPDFPEDGFVSLPIPELAHHFQELQKAYVALIQSESTLQGGCIALRLLTERSTTNVLLMTSQRFKAFVSEQAGQGQVVVHEDQGLAIYKMKPK